MSFTKVLGVNGISAYPFTAPYTVTLDGDNFIDLDMVKNLVRGSSIGFTDWTNNNFRNPAGWEAIITVITPATEGSCVLTMLNSNDDETYIEAGDSFVSSEHKNVNVQRVYSEGNNISFDVTELSNTIRIDSRDLSRYQRLNIALAGVDTIQLCVTFVWGHQRKKGADIYS